MKTNIHILKLNAILLLINIIPLSAQVEDRLNMKDLPPHPRILLLEGEEYEIKKNIGEDQFWKSIHLFILDKSNNIIVNKPVERILIGRRLLDKSRETLRRVFFLSYAWRMTSESRYLERAEKELLAVADFSDWNPSHFLDVAEMTMAVAIGYDWLYNGLSSESRRKIKDAIIRKGLNPSLYPGNNSWVKASHNWNQVCNAGMTFGALAVYEDEPELAKEIIERSVNSIRLPMEDYQPDGAYPEGYGYWGYGTNFNIMFLSAMEKVFGNEYGITINRGFFKTAEYLENMTGPTGNSFNYSDGGAEGNINPAMFWFAQRLNEPSLLWSERYHILRKGLSDNRLLPALMIWGAGITIDKIKPPLMTIWTGQGKNPVALMRSSWTDPDAIFVGIKGGSPSVNHGHMDVGSFVMEADGERWFMDFGAQDYNSLETAGVKLWSMAQNSQRWEVFRYNNFVHNTLTVNNQLQDVEGYAEINSYSDNPLMMNAITDISSAYKTNLKSAKRGIAIAKNKYVIIRDEIESTDTVTVIRWNLLTSASVSIIDNKTAVLTKNGKTLTIAVKEPLAARLKTWSTEPLHSYDAPNPGTILIGFECIIPASSNINFTVLLLPEGAEDKPSVNFKNLESWPKTAGNK